MKDKTNRIVLLDELRGFAIVAMVVHHTFLDIGNMLGLDWGFTVFQKLSVLQPLFWSIFIIISGICSRLSRNTLRRGAVVLGAGLAITLVTTVILPHFGVDGMEIRFGILSCLGCCMILTGLLMPLIEKMNDKIGMPVSAVLFAVTYGVSQGTLLFGLVKLPAALYRTNFLMPLGFYNDSFFSADYFALLPWFFLFLFGAFFGKAAKDGKFPQWTYRTHSKVLAFVGRNSLWVYLAHQPVIFGVLWVVSEIIVWIYQ